MKPPYDPDGIIAQRTFDSELGPVELRIHKPRPWPSDTVGREPDWVCWYSIQYPGERLKTHSAAGVDGIQAMLLAFASAAVNLRYFGDGTPARRPPLKWLGEDDLGLTINHFE
ncbi:DUF6968 family protein [Sphingomonas carotinifaciens]|uniref:DUF6968 family protein n=1 Tax=Sphingomonas carotinifaciens TaxID=1166323 RepID=UPI0032EBF831